MGWGLTSFDEWFQLFVEHYDKKGATVVGKELGYGKSAMCQVRKCSYKGSTDNVAAKVMEVYGMRGEDDVPKGWVKDAKGRLVKKEDLTERDLLCEDVVLDIVGHAKGLSNVVDEFKEAAVGAIDEFVKISAEKYGKKIGGLKGNVQLLSYDGRFMVRRAVSDLIMADERILVARELFFRCLDKWGEDIQKDSILERFRTLVMRGFKLDSSGKVVLSKLMELLQTKFDDRDWKKAQEALLDSLKVVGSSIHVRVYERVGTTDRYELITTTKVA